MAQTTAASSFSSPSCSLALGRSTQCKQWRWLPGGRRSCAEDGMRHAASVAATSLFTFETKNHKQIRVHACTYLLMLAHTCTKWIVYRKVTWTPRALFELRIATASQVRFRMRMWQTTLLVMTFNSVGNSPMKKMLGKPLQHKTRS